MTTPTGFYADGNTSYSISLNNENRPSYVVRNGVRYSSQQDPNPLTFVFKCRATPPTTTQMPKCKNDNSAYLHPKPPTLQSFMAYFYDFVVTASSGEISIIAYLANNEAFRTHCEMIIVKVQRDYFPIPEGTNLDNFALTLDQQREFIRLFYTILARDLSLFFTTPQPLSNEP